MQHFGIVAIATTLYVPSCPPPTPGYLDAWVGYYQADASVDAPPDVPPLVNHILVTGQSLSLGALGTPPLSTASQIGLMFNGGLSATTEAGQVALVALHEAGQESPWSALANVIGLSTTLVSTHGVGATSYEYLKKGSIPYNNGLAQVRAGKLLATGHSVTAVMVVHGESDASKSNTHYRQDMLDWQRDYDTDVQAITGQAAHVPLYLSQISSWTKYGTVYGTIANQQWRASTDRPDLVFLVGPKYMLPYVDGIHLTNNGYRWLGEYYAKAYLAGTWRPLEPTAARLEGNTVVVTFHVPVLPLVWDTWVSNPGKYGFTYTDASNPPAISSVSINGNTVRVTLAAVPTGANKRIRYAYTGVLGNPAGRTSGPRGNLRDSDSTPSLYGNTLYNWCIHFDIGVSE